MKTALSVVFYIFESFSILFSFVGMSVLFDPNKTQKGIDVFLIISFIGWGVSFIILDDSLYVEKKFSPKS